MRKEYSPLRSKRSPINHALEAMRADFKKNKNKKVGKEKPMTDEQKRDYQHKFKRAWND